MRPSMVARSRLSYLLNSAFVLVLLDGCGKFVTDQSPGGESTVTRKPTILSAAGFDPSVGEASEKGRMMIGRGKDYAPIAGDPATVFTNLEASMQSRRRTAWNIVEAMLEPQAIKIGAQTYDVPLWHPWYEGKGENRELDEK